MTGKRYYISTVASWKRHAARFSNSHWVALTTAQPSKAKGSSEAVDDAAGDAPILVLIEADEGAHLALEDDPAFEALPHPLAQKPISEKAQRALVGAEVSQAATTFDVAETFGRLHPLLRHRVF